MQTGAEYSKDTYAVDVRGMSLLDYDKMDSLRKAIASGTVTSLEIDDPDFDPILGDLIKGWAANFKSCYYLACQIPGTSIIVYYVVVVAIKHADTEFEQIIARSMMYSIKTRLLSRVQLKELITTFRVYEPLNLETIDSRDDEEEDHPTFIATFDELDKII